MDIVIVVIVDTVDMRQCQIRVRFESRVKKKFLEPLNQILKLKF